ncbi:glycine-rich domain-containing protein [Pseudomonas brassicacearum]|uniref:glycine-rich domain-containing protein n=1 Tax=Pseudomonas brassicacearum TaxID=930166 RepID=UPI0039E1066E
MADLPESQEWASGVYQLETSDPVLGGPEGISNQQAKQLANRTSWLKKKIESFLDGSGISFASLRDAEKGTDTKKPMNALRVFQAISAKVVQATIVAPGIARIATHSMVLEGTDYRSMVTPHVLREVFPFRGRQVFKVPGVFTWKVPSGVTKVWVEVIGGGGGGARYKTLPGPSGGAGGGIARKLYDLGGQTSVTVTVGAGGIGALVDGGAGTAGGTSSFGNAVAATGGGGGLNTGHAPFGGHGMGGDENHSLGPAGHPIGHANNNAFRGGAGGGGESISTSDDTRKPSAPGQGGGGRVSNAAPDGAGGQVTIQW